MVHVPTQDHTNFHPHLGECGKVPPPDGGFGWLVVFASFMMHGIAGGSVYAYGIFIPGIAKDLTNGETTTPSAIVSVLFGVIFCSGPFVGAAVNVFGCRKVAITGSLIATVGFLISGFVKNVYALIITVGIPGGIGLGMTYLPSVVIVSHWFEKHLALTTGLVVCAEGFGHFGASFLFDQLATEVPGSGHGTHVQSNKTNGKKNPLYIGWDKSQLVLAGILGLCTLFGILYRLPKMPKSASKPALTEQTENKQNSVVEIKTEQMIPESSENTDPNLTNTDSGEGAKVDDALTSERGRGVEVNAEVDNLKSTEPAPAADLVNHHCLNPHHHHHPHRHMNFHKKLKMIFTTLDVKLLKDEVFVYFLVAQLINSFGTNTVNVTLPNLNQHNLEFRTHAKHPADISWAVSSVGIAFVVARIGLGFISDLKFVNRLFVLAGGICVAGISIGILTYPRELLPMICACIFFGIFSSFYITLTPVVLIDLLGVEHLNNAFGFVLCAQGFGAVLGPPIIGAINDFAGGESTNFKGDEIGYWVAGGLTILSGLMLFLIPWLQKRQIARLLTKASDSCSSSSCSDIGNENILDEPTLEKSEMDAVKVEPEAAGS